MAIPPTKPVAAPKWQRGFFVAILVILLSLPNYSCGQETATLSATEETIVAIDTTVDAETDVVGEDVTDLGDLVNDATADFTEAVQDMDAQNVQDATDVVDDADGKTAKEPTTPTASSTEAEETAEAASAATTGQATDEEKVPKETGATSSEADTVEDKAAAPVVQSGPFIDLLGESLLSLEMVDEARAQVHQHYTNEALRGKTVVGLYFSADWCGPCRQFTPDLVNFYNKMNSRRGKQNEFEIVWISRCRTVDDFGQYFTHMNWLALPPNEAMGQRGQMLGDKYKVKSIPTLVLLDEIGNVITTDGRNKIPMDKAGIGFPWRSPISLLISTLVPRSFRLLVKTQLAGALGLVRTVLLGKKGA